MSVIKSFSVGDGDTFYIKHGSDNFTIIDCNLISELNEEEILDELEKESKNKGIRRFISTHPDDDHIHGLKKLHKRMNLLNFYCVKNEAIKDDETDDFNCYCELRDSEKKAFYLYKGCSRRWMNQGDGERGSSGINILWPIRDNKYFNDALEEAKDGKNPNNISPIIKYSMNKGASMIWMGDLESSFMENIIDKVSFSKVNILFAPHHGRKTGKVPKEWLEKMDPDIIIIGEALSEDLDYYNGYNTITQNSAGDILFETDDGKLHIYVSTDNYKVDFLNDEKMNNYKYYIGSLDI